ncbi:hypothetical protein AU255_03875 [Methyloprofundus sedimenti]|uniref:PEP-CTERM protein-sorting domain-containing protein n=1 Tax=Methyloprofundus sedimenti TaxID=1420851 RepID=A0A1V8M6D6_9GAMM|nr:VPLPA-CTERM sorting domain-containing protein [Methyloprofundus sedimenti]OQK17046.1 hypothetical protein AU255_03875 [Methyloprofundus sedimenti]
MKIYFNDVFLGLMSLFMLISSSIVTAATATTCGSVSMTPSDSSTGSIACQAYGPGNIEHTNGLVDIKSGALSLFSTLPTSYGAPLAYFPLAYLGGEGTNNGFTLDNGNFSIGASIWDTWDSIYVTIKQGDGHSGGGWAMFLVSAEVNTGTYATKLQGKKSGYGISHFFVVGGEAVGEVPIPAAAWLFGSALVGLFVVGRKRSNNIV